jgi:hypothetical protein
MSNQFQRQPRPAKLEAILDAHRRCVHLYPARLRGFGTLVEEHLLLFGRRLHCAFVGRLLHTEPSRLIEPTQPGYDTLSRTTFGAIRFDKRPIGVSLAVLLLKKLADKHDQMLPVSNEPPRPEVLTTSRSMHDRPAIPEPIAKSKRLTQKPRPKDFGESSNFSTTGEVGLEKNDLVEN